VGRCVLGFEHTSCDLVRRGAGKPWSAACPRSVGPFLSSVLEQFFHRSGRGILDGFTLLVAASAFLTLAQHGALRVAFKTEVTLELRVRQAARGLWCGVLAFAAAITVVSFRVEPHLDESLRVRR